MPCGAYPALSRKGWSNEGREDRTIHLAGSETVAQRYEAHKNEEVRSFVFLPVESRRFRMQILEKVEKGKRGVRWDHVNRGC